MKYLNSKTENIFIINGAIDNNKIKDFMNFLYNLPTDEVFKNALIFTHGRKDAEKIVQEYSNYYPNAIIYSVGGDGTLNEIVNGINPNSKLAIVPLGTGNDFYKVYKEKQGINKINIGLVNDRKFINIASLGLDAEIARQANLYKSLNKYTNKEYIVGLLKMLISNPHYKTDIGDIKLFAVCNGKYYGNGLPINPNYDLNDNLFEIYFAHNLTRFQILKLFVSLLKEEHHKNNKVRYYQTDEIEITAPYNLICNVDGEIITDNHFNLHVKYCML